MRLQGLTEEEAAEKYDRVDVYSRAFRPMYARICARSTRCAETGGSIPGAVAGLCNLQFVRSLSYEWAFLLFWYIWEPVLALKVLQNSFKGSAICIP
eukprot:936431-Pelagomonas_calceolata.AAC.5